MGGRKNKKNNQKRLNKPGYFDLMMFDHVKTKGKHKGKCGYGWPYPRVRWCTGKLKRDSFKKYVREKYGQDYIKYVGIAFDEFKLILRINLMN